MNSDPEFRKLVADSEITYEYIRYKKYEQLRNQLRAFDQHQLTDEGLVKKTGLFKSGVFAILALLVIGVIYLNYHFAVNKIAERNLVGPNTDIGNANEFHEAIDLFRAGNFEASEKLFLEIASEDTYGNADLSSWNGLMSKLAHEGFNDQVLQKLLQYASSEDMEIMNRSRRILAFYHSSAFQMFIFRCRDNLSTIKPRLM
jgi:hypothetical protein